MQTSLTTHVKYFFNLYFPDATAFDVSQEDHLILVKVVNDAGPIDSYVCAGFDRTGLTFYTFTKRASWKGGEFTLTVPLMPSASKPYLVKLQAAEDLMSAIDKDPQAISDFKRASKSAFGDWLSARQIVFDLLYKLEDTGETEKCHG